MDKVQRRSISSSLLSNMNLYGYYLIFAVLFFLPLSMISCANHQKEDIRAQKGVLDLTNGNTEPSDILNLDGEWEFYWNRLLDPSDFTAENTPDMTAYMQVPGCWDADHSVSPSYPATGCATYRLRVRTGDNYQLYGLMVPETLTSYKLWVNGMLAAETGHVSQNPAEMQPQYAKRVVYFEPRNGELDIIWQVANSNYRKSGIWLSIKIGPSQKISALHDRMIAVEIFLAGCLLIMALYHIGLYIYRRKDPTPLYFGLFCLIIVLRILTTGELLLETAVPSFNWEIARKMELSAFYAGGTFFMLFLHSVFPRDLSMRIIQILAAISGAMGLFVLAAPVRLGNHLVVPLEIVVMAGLLYLLVGVLRATYHRRKGSIYILFGFLTIILAAVNDILYSNAVIMTFYMVPFGLLILIFSQSLMLAMRFSESFSTVEKLSEDLTGINASMKRFVPYEFLNYLGHESIVNVAIGDQTHEEMTVFFADIRSFTSTAEKMTPQEVINFLNSYLSLVAPVIRVHKGFIDKFIGDAIMALFPEGGRGAVNAAIAVQKLLRIYNSENEGKHGFPIELGIGLHTGRLMLGTVGDRKRLDTTVISDAVNLASRIENLTRVYGADILVSEELLKKEDVGAFRYRYIDRVKVKGKSEPVTLYEILDGLNPEIIDLRIQTKELFEQATRVFRSNDLAAAEKLFREVLGIDPNDGAAAFYLDRCIACAANPLLFGEDGITIMSAK